MVAVEPPTIGTELRTSIPNPFSRATSLHFALPEQSPVSLRVYDMTGRLVRVLLEGAVLPPGEHAGHWDGRRLDGVNARPGVYFWEISVAGRRETRRVVLLR
jgi:flagellar hook assembly protein FlgD